MGENKGRRSNGDGTVFQRVDGTYEAKIMFSLPGIDNYTKSFTSSDISPKGKTAVTRKLNNFKVVLKTHPHIIVKLIEEDGKINEKKLYRMVEFEKEMEDENIEEDNSIINNGETAEEYMTNWLTEVKFIELKGTSYDRLEATINNQIIPNVGHLFWSRLTSTQIQELVINKLLEMKKSKSTIVKAYLALNSCYKYSVAHGDVKINPMELVKMPGDDKFDDDGEGENSRAFDDIEKERFKKAALFTYKNGSMKYRYGYAFIFIMNTGPRAGEAIATKWSDVDWKKERIRIRRNIVELVNRNKKEGEPAKITKIQNILKTKKSHRYVPLNKIAIESLKKLKKLTYRGEDSWIISDKNGNYLTPSSFRHRFRAIADFAKLENCGIHTLRHTFATSLFYKKVDIKKISAYLGHASVAITYDVYIHVIESMNDDTMENIDEI